MKPEEGIEGHTLREEEDSQKFIPVILHGITGRMGGIAFEALKRIGDQGGVATEEGRFIPTPIGLGRNPSKLEALRRDKGLKWAFTDLDEALHKASAIHPEVVLYHNSLPTGVRHQVLMKVIPQLDPSTTAVFCEKPLAANYREAKEVVDLLECRRFQHGVVHDMLETPGVRKALELIPRIKPLTCQMTFGYEVGAGFSENPEYRGQRPDFNWILEGAGGGIILDMCHEAYLSRALFGPTDRLSAVARRLVPRRMSVNGKTVIYCDVEDYVSIRREHVGGVVNASTWSWFRRMNSEFGPLEVHIDGEMGSLVFGLYGLKVQWKESAPANLWQRSVAGQQTRWLDFWEYVELRPRDPFAVELERFIRCAVGREKYPYDAVASLESLGEVEALYQSAAQDGAPIHHRDFLHYPDEVETSWSPERLQSRFGV